MWYIIINPTAGGGRAGRRWPEIARILQQDGWAYTHHFTTGSGEAETIARDAIRQGYRKLLAIGGDGTNHEVCNGILGQSDVPSAEIQYALLPIGTGNDWVKSLGLHPRQWQRWLRAIPQASTRLLDAGRVDFLQADESAGQRFFVNVAGLAYDAFVVREMSLRADVKGKPWLYLWWILKLLFRFRPPAAAIQFGDEQVSDQVYTVNIGLGRYSGGGMQFTPQAEPGSGRFALTIAREVSIPTVLWNTPRFYSGTLGKHPRITLHHAEQVAITSTGPEDVLLEADGEYLGKAPATFHMLPGALQVFVPENKL
ncbi:MAG: diacylglycerol kinase family lipid kinase [Lewinellaceae bacterium]|nr:diacylglycerol kinase family lipid kinase [Lewinellaceae bacterium]